MNREKKKVKTIRDISYLYLSNISSSLIGIVYFLIIARLLSSYEFGIVTTLILIYTFAITVGNLGISYSIPKFITQAIAQNKKSVAYEIFIKLLIITIISSIIFGLIFFLLSTTISFYLVNSNNLTNLLYLLSISVSLSILLPTLISSIQALQLFAELSLIKFLYLLIRKAGAILLLLLGFGLEGIVIGWIIGDLIAIILCFKISIKKLIINRIEYKINSVIKFALPMWGVGIMNFVFLWIDKFIILSTLTLENLGIYQISIMMWGFIILFPQSVLGVIFPYFSENYSIGGLKKITNMFRVITRYITYIQVPIVFLSVVFAPSIITYLFEGRYNEAIIPFNIMTLGVIAYTVSIPATTLMWVLNKTREYFIIITVSLVTSFGLLIIIPIELTNLAIARMLSQYIILILTILFLYKNTKIKFPIKSIVKTVGASFIMSTIFLLPITNYAVIPIYIIIYLSGYVLILIFINEINLSDVKFLKILIPKQLHFLIRIIELVIIKVNKLINRSQHHNNNNQQLH